MKKFLIAGALILLFNITTSNGKKATNRPAVHSGLAATMDSLKQAAQKLETSTERMNKSLSNIK
jgi:hypothetical protein